MRIGIVSIGILGLLIGMFTSSAHSIEPEKAIGVWLFDEGEGDVAADSSGNSHDGQILADVKWTEGMSGSALEFPGYGDASYVKVPHESTLELVEHSITAWVKVASTEVMPTESAWQLLVGKWQPRDVRNYGIMAKKDSGVTLAQFTSGGVRQYKTVMGKTGLADGKWHHVACTYDGSSLRIYVDGVMEAEVESAGPDASQGDLTIGASLDGMFPTKGVIDDVGLFNVALGEDDIKEIMTGGLGPALGMGAVGDNMDMDAVVEKAVELAIGKALEKAAGEAEEEPAEEDEFGSVEFGGVLEGQFGHVIAEDDTGNDFTLATVELGTDVSLGPNVSGHVVFLYEQGENDDNIAVDTGTIDLSIPTNSPVELSLSFGLMCVPFGEYNSHFLADPYTLEIGETSQLALQLGAAYKVVSVSAALYNEEVGVVGDSNTRIGDVAARIAISAPEGVLGDGGAFTVGTSFITNVAGTDGLSEMIEGGEILERTAGLGAFISLSILGASLETEFIQVVDNIQIPDGGETLKPRAFNAELGYSLPDMPVSIAVRFEQLSESGHKDTRRFGGVASLGLFGGASFLTLEFLRTDDGDVTEDSIVTQLAVEF